MFTEAEGVDIKDIEPSYAGFLVNNIGKTAPSEPNQRFFRDCGSYKELNMN